MVRLRCVTDCLEVTDGGGALFALLQNSISLCTTFASGCVCVWSDKERVKREETGVHKHSAVKLLVWSPDGSRLISGDQVRGARDERVTVEFVGSSSRWPCLNCRVNVYIYIYFFYIV
jgi:hypothetical protein